MLTEHFVASTHVLLKAPAAGSRDASIFVNELQPLAGQRQTFKRSATAQNCLAASDTHIFAAQAEKAVVHVYNREKGSHEATIPFNEKITSLALAASGLVLLLGTEGGRLMAWELATGRLASTSQSHLQAVTGLAIDPTSNFLLSGSRDSNVLVWSLRAILSFSNSETTNQSESRSPVHSLSSQRGPITALVVGHGHGQANIAVSASEDQSIVVWDYKKGIALRTYLLRGIPRALVLDSSDRGFYTTYDDGSVQLVDFYADSLHINALYDEDVTTPVQPGDNHVWKAEGQELGDGLSLAISWDGTRLLSGHRSGKIASWDVRKGSFMAVVDTLSGTVSNLVMLPVQGLLNNGGEQTRLAEIVKPRLAPSEGDGATPGDYAFSAQLKTKLFASRFRAAGNAKAREQSSLQWALAHPSFSSDLLEGGITELASADLAPAKTAHGELRLDAGSVNDDEGGKVSAGLKAQNDHLTQQVAHLQKLQKASFAQIREKTRVIAALVKEQEQLAEIAKREYGWEIADANVEWNLYQQRQLKDHKQIESVNGNGSITARSDEVTAEGEDEHMSDGTNGKLDRG